jgi:hypothetical protein
MDIKAVYNNVPINILIRRLAETKADAEIRLQHYFRKLP